MRRLFLLAVLLSAALWPVGPVHAQSAGPHVTNVIKVDGIIDARVARMIERGLDEAKAGGLVIIQMDTPGSLGIDFLELASKIADAHVPVVVWVGPPGSIAQGSSILMLEAADIAVTSPRSGVGPARPLNLGGRPPLFRLPFDPSPDFAEHQADSHGRNGTAVRALFAPGARGLAAGPAVTSRVVDQFASSIPELLRDLDGREVDTPSGTQTLVTSGDAATFTLRFTELGPIDRTLHAVSSPSAAYLLLVLGLWAVAFELVQPGFGLAGFTGILFLGLAAYAMTVVTPSWLGLGLVVGGVGLYVMDVRMRNLGLLTILGTAAFATGSFLIYRHVAPAIDVAPWVIWLLVIGSVLYFGFALTVAIRAREQAMAQRQSGLVGLVGETVGDLAPEGQVVVKGAMWQGRALGDSIPGGSRVRVRHVEGLILEVTAEPAEPKPKPKSGSPDREPRAD